MPCRANFVSIKLDGENVTLESAKRAKLCVVIHFVVFFKLALPFKFFRLSLDYMGDPARASMVNPTGKM